LKILHGSSWLFMAFYGSLWFIMVHYGSSWLRKKERRKHFPILVSDWVGNSRRGFAEKILMRII